MQREPSPGPRYGPLIRRWTRNRRTLRRPPALLAPAAVAWGHCWADGSARRTAPANRSAQNQEVKPVAPGFRVRCVLGMPYGTAETFFAAAELLLGETAHRGVGPAEGVHLAEEVREA